jgi:hypothetical protein
MFSNSNLSLSTEILYLSQTRYIESLGANKGSSFSKANASSLNNIARTSKGNVFNSVDTSTVKNNIQILSSTVDSAKTGLKELDASYHEAAQSLRRFLSSEEGSATRTEAQEQLNETKESVSEILIELKEIDNTQDLSDIESLIHTIVSAAITDANHTFQSLDLSKPEEALKSYYSFQTDRNNLKRRISQLDSIDDLLRQSNAGVYKLNIGNATNIPNQGFDSHLVDNDFLKSNKGNTQLMLNILNLNQSSSGRLFNYYL